MHTDDKSRAASRTQGRRISGDVSLCRRTHLRMCLWPVLVLFVVGCGRCKSLSSEPPSPASPVAPTQGALETPSQQGQTQGPAQTGPQQQGSVPTPLPSVNPGSPTIEFFRAEPSTIKEGQSVKLVWNVAGANHIGLSPYGAPKGNNVTVKPAASMTYVLAATNAKGTSTARVTINVKRSSSPRTLYVAKNGNDKGNGSQGKPFGTPQQALDDAQPDDTVIVRAGTYHGVTRFRHPNVTLRAADGEKVVLQVPTNNEDLDTAVQIDPEAHNTRLQGLEIIGGAYYGIAIQTTWDWGDPILRSGPGGVVIEDCYIHDTGRDGIKVTPGTDDVTIRRCTIAFTGKRSSDNADGIDNVNGDRMVVEDTWIHDIATSGIYFKGGSIGSRIERSLVMNCGEAGILLGFDTSPEFFDKALNPAYYDCIDCIARNNIVNGTDYAGIGFFATLRGKAYHNTVINTGRKGHSAVHYGLVLHDWEKGIPCPGSKDPEFINNIVIQPANAKNPMVQIRFSEDNHGVSGLQGNPIIDFNRYFQMGSKAVFSDRRPPNDEFDAPLAKWQKHVNGDLSSTEGDPKLDAALRIAAGSPCIDRGKPGLASDDYNGNPRRGTPDIGAEEFGAGPQRKIPPPPGFRGTKAF